MKKLSQIFSIFLLIALVRGFFPSYALAEKMDNFSYKQGHQSSELKKIFDLLIEKTELKNEKKEKEAEVPESPIFSPDILILLSEINFLQPNSKITQIFGKSYLDFRANHELLLYIIFHSLKLDC